LDAVDRMFELAASGKEKKRANQIQPRCKPVKPRLATAVSRLLCRITKANSKAADQIAKIYDGVQHQLYLLLGATLSPSSSPASISFIPIAKIFARLELLSGQRSELAQKLIHTQESTLRHISRELHDEFGQVLTAIGVMLGRAGKQVPADAPVHADLQEVREIAQSTLNIFAASRRLFTPCCWTKLASKALSIGIFRPWNANSA